MNQTVVNLIFREPRSRDNDLKVLKALAYSKGLSKYDVAKKVFGKDKFKIPDDQAAISTLGRRIDALCDQGYVIRTGGQTSIRKKETDVFEVTRKGFYAILLCDDETVRDWRTIVKNYPEYFGGSFFDRAMLEKGSNWCFEFFYIRPYQDLLTSRKINFDLDWQKIEEEMKLPMDALMNWFIGLMSDIKLDEALVIEGKLVGANETFENFMRRATIEDVQSIRSISRKPEVCQEIVNHFRSKKEKLMREIQVCEKLESAAVALPKMLDYADQELPKLLESISRIRKMEKERRGEI